jgi:hypothetical protein
VVNPQSQAFDVPSVYTGTATLALDFENPVYLANSGDLVGPDIGTNYIFFGVSQAASISARIFEPISGRTLALYSGYVPGPTEIALLWNFTESDGTAFTNASYTIQFAASGNTLTTTNTIDRDGVRRAAGIIIVRVDEVPHPSDPQDNSALFNSWAIQYIDQTLVPLYQGLYDALGITQYTESDIGVGRNQVALFIINTNTAQGFRPFMQTSLSSQSPLYSDITIGPAHGFAPAFGANGAGANGMASSEMVSSWTTNAGRMRKVAMWSCYSGANGYTTNYYGYPPFADAWGIRGFAYQAGYQVTKNGGLFWTGYLPQQGSPLAQNWAQLESIWDFLWVTGPNGFPGGCDPTYAFMWVYRQLINQYPELVKCGPYIAGFGFLPYTGVQDDRLRSDWSWVHGQ